mgnify:CR=1 FL=1
MKYIDKASKIFIGVVYIVVGFLILEWPRLLYYWVAGVFLILGLTSLFRAFAK